MTAVSPNRRSISSLLRKVATAMFLMFSILWAVLWLRNFWLADVAWAPLPGQGYLAFASQQGQMELSLYLPFASTPVPQRQTSARWGVQSYTATGDNLYDVLLPRVKLLRFRRYGSIPRTYDLNAMAPYWFLLPVTWMLAAAPWVRWSVRFSLRAMLIAMTLVAVALGVYVTSKW